MSKIWEKFKGVSGGAKALVIITQLVVLALLASWYDEAPVVSPTVYVAHPAIKGTAVPKVFVPVTSVKVIPKSVVKKALPNLPPELDEENIEVTDTAEVPASENGTKVISTINTVTGETTLITKPNARALMAFENRWRVGIGYGVGTEGTTAKLFGEYTAARVGNFHIGAQAEIVTTTYRSPEAKILAVIDYRNK